jgi:EmrB/QacA subfamily drug resistance transporter
MATEATVDGAVEREKSNSTTPQDEISASEQEENKTVAETPAVDAEGKPIERSSLTVTLIMLALCFAVFLHALDTTIITTALPTITEAFNSDVGYTWVGSAYLLGVAATTIIWGKLSDIFGRKPVILAANLTFFTGSLIAALSVNIAMLIVARAIQGIGGAGLNVLANICIGDLFSPRERGLYYGIIGMVWAVAMTLGPVIGGAFTENVSWRWCFYVNLPFNGVAFTVIFLFLDLKIPKTPLAEGIKAIDWVAVLLSIGGTIMVLLGLSFGGVTDPWNSAVVICLIIFGFVCWMLCFAWEGSLAKYPLLPTFIFTHVPSLAVLGVCFIQSYVFIAAAYYLPLYFQAVLGVTPILSGVYLLPTAVSLSIASIATGMYMRKTGTYIVPMWIGFVLMTLGNGLFINLGPTANWAKIIIYQVIAGFGVGPTFQAPMVALQSFTPPRDIAVATSSFAFTRNLASAVGIVIGQVVFQNEMTKHQDTLVAILGPELAIELGGPAAGAHTQLVRALPQAQRDALHVVFADSIKWLWVMYTAFSGASLVICMFIPQKKLTDEHKETETGLEGERKGREERLQREKEKRDAKNGNAAEANNGIAEANNGIAEA